jgi:glycosyltransferase involved in cell wall biosynthesis
LCYRNKTIGVVVPAFNEELLIEDTLRSIPAYVDRVYVVDDCSKDRTAEIARGFENNDPRFACISHEQNKGVGAAIITGYKKALQDGVEITAVMAGDNQMDPRFLPDLMNPIIDEKAEFTKGNRLMPGYWKGMSPWRLFGNTLLNILNKIASGYWNINDPQNGYVAISSSSLANLDLENMYNGYAFENDMMVKANIAGIEMLNVRIPAKYGNEKSKIRYSRFMIKTSLFLFNSFLWRIWNKYLKKGHPLGFLYLIGSIGVIVGIFAAFFEVLDIIAYSLIIFIFSCVWEARGNKLRGGE